jgi:Glycosyl transferase family 2
MIGIAIPAHNEATSLAACLDSVLLAARHPALDGEQTDVIVVLDACTDASIQIAASRGVRTVSVNARNVGVARALGARCLLGAGARWLAFTDADSRVAPDWLVAQLALRADAVCGCIEVDDWTGRTEEVRRRFLEGYTHADGHRHIHGANLGVSSHAYRRCGGFQPVKVSEDVALVDALLQCEANIVWSSAPRVTTSARADARARGGFGDTLSALGAVAHDRMPPTLDTLAGARPQRIATAPAPLSRHTSSLPRLAHEAAALRVTENGETA